MKKFDTIVGNIKDLEVNTFRKMPDEGPGKAVTDQAAQTLLQEIIDTLNGVGATTVSAIENIVVAADTESSFALPTNTSKFLIRSRLCGVIKFSYEAAPTEFLTIPAGASYDDDQFYQSQTIYFTSSINDIVEIVTHSKP